MAANTVSNQDRARAQALMLAQRQENQRTSSAGAFTYKEANPVLTNISLGLVTPVTPGLVLELLSHGASVCTKRPKSRNFLKILTGEDQVDVRSDVLLNAIKHCSVEIFNLLVAHADKLALDLALPVAIGHSDTSKVSILLQAGANASEWHNLFLSSVDTGSDAMVEVLLSQVNGVCQHCHDSGLVRAARIQSVRKVQILVENGADVTFDSAAALNTAIQTGREDVVTIIALHASPRLPQNLLDIAVGEAYARGQYGIVKLCLQAGARGEATDATLVEAVRSSRTDLVDCLILNHASLDYGEGAALKAAVQSRKPEFLRSLLQGKPSQALMALAAGQVAKLNDLDISYQMLCLLLARGLRGIAINESLVEAINPCVSGNESTRLELLRVLLQNGDADINAHGGEVLVRTAAQGRRDILELLLQHQPSVDSLNAALGSAMQLKEPIARFDIAQMLLISGASGPKVDDALAWSGGGGPECLKLTSLLLKYGSVDSDGGRPLVSAVRSRHIGQLQILLTGRPSHKSLASAWAEIDGIEGDESFQADAYHSLLETRGIASLLQDRSLIIAAAKGSTGLEICEILLNHSASPQSFEGAAVKSAAKGLHLETLDLFSKYITSVDVFRASFTAAVAEDFKWLTPRGLEVVQYLLGCGVYGPEVDKAFCKAAELYHQDAVEMLKLSAQPEALNAALELVCRYPAEKTCSDDTKLRLVSSLLEGASGQAVNRAFLSVVEAFVHSSAPEYLIDTILFSSEANVNYERGRSLKIAIRGSDSALLQKLISSGADQNTLTEAFAEIITAPIEEDAVLTLLDILTNTRNLVSLPNFSSTLSHGRPPIIACLETHRQSDKLVKRLIKLGCDIEAQVAARPYDEKAVDWEYVPALSWSLCQIGEGKIGHLAIKALINSGGKATPLILAAKYNQDSIVNILVKAGADVNARDYYDRSSLFYAAQAGNLDSVKALTKAKCPTNDGSLHEAARSLHHKVVTTLVKSKHNPNFPSTKEDYRGRTPLQEMVYNSDGTSNIADIEDTIVALVEGGADLLGQWWGSNALFLAMSNRSPWAITHALLEKGMWQHLNDEANVILIKDNKRGTAYYLSPTVYIKQCYVTGSQQQVAGLLQLLYDTGCEDRFYAPLGAIQPEGAVGLPPHIQEFEAKRKDQEEKRRIKEDEHRAKLQREWEDARNKTAIEHLRLDSWKYQEREKASQKQGQAATYHQQQLFQQAQTTSQQQAAMIQKSEIAASTTYQAAMQKMSQTEMMHQQQLNQKAQLTRQQQDGIARTNALNAAKQHQANLERIEAEQRMISLREVDDRRKLKQKQKLDNETLRMKKKEAEFQKAQTERTMQVLRAKRQHS